MKPVSTERSAPPQERDRLRSGQLALIGLGVLVVFAITVTIANGARGHWAGQVEQAVSVPPAIGHEELNELYQLPFPVENRGFRDRSAQKKWLHSWGWVDRSQGRIHIPIEVAIEEALGRGEKRGER